MSSAILTKSKEAVVDALSRATEALQVNPADDAKTSSRQPEETIESENGIDERQTSHGSISATKTVLTSSVLLDLPKYYVDEVTGSDDQGDGSEALPYKSVLGAYIARSSSTLNLFTRKAEDTKLEPSTHTPAGSVLSVGQASWQPVSASAQKKAKKLYEQHQKKLARQAELADKEKEKEALELKKLEEAKKIVLAEPAGGEQAKRIKIRQAKANRGRRVRIFGWVHRLRQQSTLFFITLRDGTGFLQCVLSGQMVSRNRVQL